MRIIIPPCSEHVFRLSEKKQAVKKSWLRMKTDSSDMLYGSVHLVKQNHGLFTKLEV